MFHTQSEVRSTITYLARSAAQVPIHVYRRTNDSRERLPNHPLKKLLSEPTPNTGYFDFAERLFIDFCVYGEAIVLKARNARGVSALLPVNPAQVTIHGSELPLAIDYTAVTGERVENIPIEDAVYLREPDPSQALRGLSRLESLRQVLSAEAAAVQSRHAFFANGARPGAVIEMSPETDWTQEQRESFSKAFAEKFSGRSKVGRVALLESGLTYKPLSMASFEESSTEMVLALEEQA